MVTLQDILDLRTNARAAAAQVEAAKVALVEAIDRHNSARRELFDTEFTNQKLAWCNGCSEVKSDEDMKLLLLEGTEEYRHGYENSYYGFRVFSRLHLLCPACYTKARNRHGWCGEYDATAGGQEKFYAFQVEQRVDGIFVCRYGEWAAIDPNIKVPSIWDHVVERLCQEWNLPPKLEIEHGTLKDSEWIVAGEPA